jgi:hypothetical protein
MQKMRLSAVQFNTSSFWSNAAVATVTIQRFVNQSLKQQLLKPHQQIWLHHPLVTQRDSQLWRSFVQPSTAVIDAHTRCVPVAANPRITLPFTFYPYLTALLFSPSCFDTVTPCCVFQSSAAPISLKPSVRHNRQ